MCSIHKSSFILLFLILIVNIGFTQTVDTTGTDTGEATFIDLSGDAVRIKAEPEKPRVNIISNRIKPEFDDVNLEKSFKSELAGKGESIIVVEKEESTNIKPIEIDKIINRKR